MGRTSKFKSIRPLRSSSKFKSIGPLGSTFKLQTIRPLGSMSKIQFHQNSGKHVQNQTIGPLGSTSKIQIHRTSEKHVQNPIPIPSDLQEARPNFKSIRPPGSTSKLQTIKPLGSTSKIQFHRTSRKYVQTSNPSELWKACPKFKITIEILILSWLLVSKSCTHFFFPKKKKIKNKKGLHVWTTFGPDPLIKRYVGNLPGDSVHILIHYMMVCILIYMHHTFTTIKY